MASQTPTSTDFERAASAVVDGDVEVLRDLLDENPSLTSARSERDHGGTLLHYAASNGVEDERQRIPPNAVAIADLLIERGADINVQTEVYGGGPGSTPLVALVTSIHPAEAGLMEDLVRAYGRNGQSLEGPDQGGLPMLFALLHRNVSAAETLAACGARPRSAAAAAGLGRLDLVEQKVRPGPPPTADPADYAALGWIRPDPETAAAFACYMAAIGGRTRVIRWLVDQGVDVNIRIHHGLTALHEASWGGHSDAVEVLVEAGADVEAIDETHQSTPGGWAAHAGHAGIAAFLERHRLRG